jgi:hypothetical protein
MNMCKLGTRAARSGASLVAGIIGGALMLAAAHAQPVELGVMSTWLKGGTGGLAYGGSLVGNYDLCRYADVGARVGYMKSDCYGVKYVPLQLTTSLKYPLFDDRLVPYAGVGVGYNIFTGGTISLDDAWSVFPMGGINWWFSKEKKWAFFIEGRYQFMKADIQSGGLLGQDKANFGGWGGSFGVKYRF